MAEHVPDHKRGHYTSFIQTTATLGFFVSMGVIGTTRIVLGEEMFKRSGWRIPFLLSFLLLAVSMYIRIKMKESPLFAKLKSSGKVSTNPLKESFTESGQPALRLDCAVRCHGRRAVWYTV